MALYDITREELDGSFKLEQQIKADSPAEAIEKAGYKPDKEHSDYAGAEPWNEYGRPWYPHIRATVA